MVYFSQSRSIDSSTDFQKQLDQATEGLPQTSVAQVFVCALQSAKILKNSKLIVDDVILPHCLEVLNSWQSRALKAAGS